MILDGESVVTSATPESETPITPTESESTQGNTLTEHPTVNDRQFTRDEVTMIVKKRTERAVNKILEKFGIENKDKIQEYLDNHNSLLETAGKYDALNSQYQSLNREHLYLKNNIIPEKYDELDKQFKDGLTEEKLQAVLQKHPEFLKPKVVIPEKLGTAKEGNNSGMTEQQLAEKLLGVKL